MQNSTPIWVKHPSTYKEINVAPLLLVLDEFDASSTGLSTSQVGVQFVDQIIRVMILSEPNPVIIPPGQRTDLFVDLYRFRDAFAEMNEQEAN